MSILRRLSHDRVASHEGVVNNARAQLDKELRPVAAQPAADASGSVEPDDGSAAGRPAQRRAA